MCARMLVRVRDVLPCVGGCVVIRRVTRLAMLGRGPIELVEYFHDKCHEEWIKDLKTLQLSGLTGTQQM